MQVLNYFAKQKNQTEAEQNQNDNSIISERQKQYEAVSGEKKSDNTYNRQTNIIEQFLNKCNDNDIEGAYDLLSDDCKKTLYPSINDFIDGYYSKNFGEKKSYSYQAWSGDTYKIELRQDILSTGMYSDSAYVEDYYTLNGNQLNINGYVKKKSVNKEIQRDNIKIRIVDINYFKDYSICNIQVFNKTEEEILLDTRDKNNTVYLVDKNKVQYNSYINELDETQLTVKKGEQKDIAIKFNCNYRENLVIQKISFNNIIMNYNRYQVNQIGEEDVKTIEVEW